MTDFTLFGLTEEDMIDRLDQALIDSMDYDWRCIDGARAIMAEIKCWVADQEPAEDLKARHTQAGDAK